MRLFFARDSCKLRLMEDWQAIQQLLDRINAEGAVLLADWPSGAPIEPESIGLQREDNYLRWLVAPDLIKKASIEAALPDLSTSYFGLIDSTNTQLMRLGASKPVAASLYVAEFQYGGRGRRGRAWLSPYGRNLSMSLAMATERHLADLGGLSIVVGLALADALEDLGLQGLQLKWPNDLLVGGCKLSGILVELLQRDGAVEFVVGIGVNVRLTEEEISQIDQPVTDLRRCAVEESRTDLVIHLVKRVHSYLQHFESEGFAPFVSAFNDLHLYHEQTCSIIQGDQTTSGVVAGIGEQGELILYTAQGERRFHGGEVSLRAS